MIQDEQRERLLSNGWTVIDEHPETAEPSPDDNGWWILSRSEMAVVVDFQQAVENNDIWEEWERWGLSRA